MEDDLNESSSSMLPVALGVLAIALGGAGLYFGMTANQRLNPISENLELSSGSAAQVEKQLATFEARLAELAAQADELNQTVGRLRVYSSQSERDAKAAISGVKANREEMVKLVEKFNGLASGATRVKPAAVATSSEATPSATDSVSDVITVTSGGAVTSASLHVYSIQPGDNFAKIASSKGVSLDALLAANPGVDPRRLQIGQKIQIPVN